MKEFFLLSSFQCNWIIKNIFSNKTEFFGENKVENSIFENFKRIESMALLKILFCFSVQFCRTKKSPIQNSSLQKNLSMQKTIQIFLQLRVTKKELFVRNKKKNSDTFLWNQKNSNTSSEMKKTQSLFNFRRKME